jgi:hypothetical protein
VNENGINDEGGAFLLRVLFQIKIFKRLHYRRNIIGNKFAQVFEILIRNKPRYLVQAILIPV